MQKSLLSLSLQHTYEWKQSEEEAAAQVNTAEMICHKLQLLTLRGADSGNLLADDSEEWDTMLKYCWVQTAIKTQSLPGSTVINNHWESVSCTSYQSQGCVHFNALSRELYGFLFWHVNIANNKESWVYVLGKKKKKTFHVERNSSCSHPGQTD